MNAIKLMRAASYIGKFGMKIKTAYQYYLFPNHIYQSAALIKSFKIPEHYKTQLIQSLQLMYHASLKRTFRLEAVWEWENHKVYCYVSKYNLYFLTDGPAVIARKTPFRKKLNEVWANGN